MSKFKELLPSIFKSNSVSKGKKINKVSQLEFDAAVVADDDENNVNEVGVVSPTASAELTASVVRELNDPNYNSVAMENTGTTTNVQNNQQQNIVMQISNANNVHFGSVFNFNNNIANNTTDCAGNLKCGAATPVLFNSPSVDGKRSTPRKTTSIVAMMQSQAEPDHRILDTISTHLGEKWKQIMRELGFSEGQIEQAIIDHQMHGGMKEVVYQLLLQWIRSAEDDTATLGFITTLLWNSNERECVQRMKSVWKSDNSRKTSS